MKRIFLDANVLFTVAHNPRGKAAFIVEIGRDGLWKLYSSAYAVAEARRNLEIKFPEQVTDFEILLGEMQIIKHQESDARLPGLGNKDQPIFQAALACSATHLVTGDKKDFGKFMNKPGETSGIIIQTPADFLRQFDLP
ncbi:MAG: PIN domain-containing protein [Gammaproteobacteria bacterium]|nr:PIN domain-containing protein [Gammaproteobacteria bacterium]MDE0512858.1 PIN domain-containing protein [Gammaproteobacteria bacterium]